MRFSVAAKMAAVLVAVVVLLASMTGAYATDDPAAENPSADVESIPMQTVEPIISAEDAVPASAGTMTVVIDPGHGFIFGSDSDQYTGVQLNGKIEDFETYDIARLTQEKF